MSEKRVLVTGGSGFIGANLVRRLLSEEVEVHVIARPESDLWRLQNILPAIHLHRVSLKDLEKLTLTLSDISPHCIFHTAAHGVMPFQKNRGEILASNVIGTYHLLEATREIDYECFVHVGSSTEYGRNEKAMCEKDRVEPVSFFGVTKACGTLLVEQFAREFAKPISIVRLFSVYGPMESPSRLIPTAIRAAFEGTSMQITEPGFVRDFVFVEDVVEACILTWKKRIWQEIINVGTGIQTSNEDVIAAIERIVSRKISISDRAYPHRLTDTTTWKADTTLMKSRLDWQPRHSFEEGLRKTIDHYRCATVSK